jgi:hypothetical protein
MLNRDFKEFAELLNARGVDYLVGLKDLADLESLDPLGHDDPDA